MSNLLREKVGVMEKLKKFKEVYDKEGYEIY